MEEPITIGWRAYQEIIEKLRLTATEYNIPIIEVPILPKAVVNVFDPTPFPFPKVILGIIRFRRKGDYGNEWEPVTKLKIIGQKVAENIKPYVSEYMIERVENGELPYSDLFKYLP